MQDETTRTGRLRDWLNQVQEGLRDYFGTLGRSQRVPVDDPEKLAQFLNTRSSFVAQTTLYGYLRTRAGMIYPQLFDDDAFVHSINIAKWHMWLACLSDISMFAGGLLAKQIAPADVAVLLNRTVASILTRTGVPTDAGETFPEHAERIRGRVASCRWDTIPDGDAAFTESPTALIQWAPVVENLKELDEEVVRNSVRFHWKTVREELRRDLDVEAIQRSIEQPSR